MDDVLLTKHLLKETSKAEAAAVLRWVAAHPENERRYRHLQRIWETSKSVERGSTVDEVAAWDRFVERRDSGTHTAQKRAAAPARRLGWLRYAAVLLVIPAAVLFVQYLRKPGTVEATYETTASVRTDTLADGTVVTLNRHAAMQYRQRPSVKRREVTLSGGEVFFQVRRHADKPFVVQSGKVAITVLGTSFHVKRRGDETEVIVETGRVKVESMQKQVELVPGQFLVINTAENRFEEGEVSDQLHNYYVNHRFELDGTPLWRIAEVLSEAYGTAIVIENPQIRNLPLTTILPLGDLGGNLRIVSQTLRISVERRDDKIILK